VHDSGSPCWYCIFSCVAYSRIEMIEACSCVHATSFTCVAQLYTFTQHGHSSHGFYVKPLKLARNNAKSVTFLYTSPYTLHTWRWRQQVHPKRPYPPTRLHSVRTQETTGCCHSSPNIIRVIISKKRRWAEHVAFMGQVRNAYTPSVMGTRVCPRQIVT
jgi:hypothetical protein